MTITISVRLPDELNEKLGEEVKRRRMADGSDATKADVIREALTEYLKK